MRHLLILLCLFIIIIISGCSRYINIPPEQLDNYSNNKVTKIKLPAKIIGVVNKADDTLYFDENGGSYYPKSFDKLTGTLTNGEDYILGIFATKRIIFQCDYSGGILIKYVTPYNLHRLGLGWDIDSDSVAIMQDIWFDFENKSGRADISQNSISGKIEGDQPATIDISSISEMTVDRFQIGESRYFAGIQLDRDNSGVSYGTLTDNAEFFPKSNKAVHFGIHIAKKYSEWFYLQLELNYSHYSFHKSYADTFSLIEMSVNQDSDVGLIEIPLLAKYMMPKDSGLIPSFYIGPAASFSFKSKDKFDSTSIMHTDLQDYPFFNSGEGAIANIGTPVWSIVLGGELNYKFNRVSLFVDLRYRAYISDVLKRVSYTEKPPSHRILADFNANPDTITLSKFSIGVGLHLEL